MVLRLADYVSSRDTDYFDSAVLMDIPKKEKPRAKVLGIALTPVNSIYFNNPAKDVALVTQVAIAINSWLFKHPDWSVVGLSLNSHPK